jgi:hypothetical protein
MCVSWLGRDAVVHAGPALGRAAGVEARSFDGTQRGEWFAEYQSEAVRHAVISVRTSKAAVMCRSTNIATSADSQRAFELLRSSLRSEEGADRLVLVRLTPFSQYDDPIADSLAYREFVAERPSTSSFGPRG